MAAGVYHADEKPVLTLIEQRELEKCRGQQQREIKRLQRELRSKENARPEAEALLIVAGFCEAVRRKQAPCLLGGGPGRLKPPVECRMAF